MPLFDFEEWHCEVYGKSMHVWDATKCFPKQLQHFFLPPAMQEDCISSISLQGFLFSDFVILISLLICSTSTLFEFSFSFWLMRLAHFLSHVFCGEIHNPAFCLLLIELLAIYWVMRIYMRDIRIFQVVNLRTFCLRSKFSFSSWSAETFHFSKIKSTFFLLWHIFIVLCKTFWLTFGEKMLPVLLLNLKISVFMCKSKAHLGFIFV